MIADVIGEVFSWAILITVGLFVIAYVVLFIWYLIAPWLPYYKPEGCRGSE